MKKCSYCKFHSKNKFNCEKITGYKPACEYFYNGAVYARPDIKNKDGTCIHYKFSLLNYIKG